MSDPVYIKSLQDAIQRLHGAASIHAETVIVKETFQGKTVWEGAVEVFDLTNHVTAKQCYAWSFLDEGGKDRQFVAVLKSPPVDSPRKAVQAYILNVAQATKQKT